VSCTDAISWDRELILELAATIYVKLEQVEKAEEQYRKLIEHNPDNLSYYGNLMLLKGIDFSSSSQSMNETSN
jgi:Tfp pilus assembly protein PilF